MAANEMFDMEEVSLRRILKLLAVTVPGCAAIAAALFFLPTAVAFVVALTGLASYKIGSDLHWKVCTICGGVLMFAALVAWAIRQ